MLSATSTEVMVSLPVKFTQVPNCPAPRAPVSNRTRASQYAAGQPAPPLVPTTNQLPSGPNSTSCT